MGRPPEDGRPAPSLEALVRRIGAAPLRHQPGEAFACSYSTTVLGAEVERVSGKPFDAVLAHRSFAPLGTTETGFLVSDADPDRVVTSRVSPVNGRE